MKTLLVKRSNKQERERSVLLGLVEFYLKTGKPVGSNTLKEAGFEDLSSATIRNYFASLEEDGYLVQQHSSGGRIPTDKALQLYVNEHIESTAIDSTHEKIFQQLEQSDSKEIARYLQRAADTLSDLTGCAVFLNAPRFDQDFIVNIKFVEVDIHRCLCVLITSFGVIHTEVVNIDKKLSTFTIKRIEGYFHWRLTGHGKPEKMDRDEEILAQHLYNEVMVRYIVGYSNFIDDEIYRTGFSKLLRYPEYQEATALSGALSLFENSQSMRHLLHETSKHDGIKVWIGSALEKFTSDHHHTAVLATPYRVNKQIVGSIGILGPSRMEYKTMFGILHHFSNAISKTLTRDVYQFKITLRKPTHEVHGLLVDESKPLLEFNPQRAV